MHGFLLEGVLSVLSRELCSQVCASCLFVVSGSIQPGVTLELLHGVALITIVAEKTGNEVLEVSGQSIAVHLLKVRVNFASDQQVVEELFFASLLERENTLYDNEQNHCHGEEVDLSTVVGLALLDFRSHVGHGSTVGFQVLDALVACKTKISNF